MKRLLALVLPSGVTLTSATAVMAWAETGRTPGSISGVTAMSQAAARGDYRWVGEGLSSHSFQTWPRAVGTRLVIDPGYSGGHAR